MLAKVDGICYARSRGTRTPANRLAVVHPNFWVIESADGTLRNHGKLILTGMRKKTEQALAFPLITGRVESKLVHRFNERIPQIPLERCARSSFFPFIETPFPGCSCFTYSK